MLELRGLAFASRPEGSDERLGFRVEGDDQDDDDSQEDHATEHTAENDPFYVALRRIDFEDGHQRRLIAIGLVCRR